MNTKIGVIGNGSWATAIVKMLTETQDEIHWWFRSKTSSDYLLENKHNPNYLSSVKFDLDLLKVTNDINDIVKACDYLILAVPSIYLNDALENLNIPLTNKIIFSAIKGIIPEKNMIVVRLGRKFGSLLSDMHHSDLYTFIDAALEMYP